LGADQLAGAGAEIKQVALAQEVFGTRFIQNDAGIDPGGDLEGDPGRNIGLDDAGDDGGTGGLGGDHQVDAGRTGLGGKQGNGVFHFGRGDLHKVGQLVDDHDNERKPVGQRFLVGRRRGLLTRQPRGEIEFLDIFWGAGAGVVGADVANPGLGHVAVALFHFVDHPFEGEKDFFRLGDDGDDEMGQTVVDLELDDLGIDKNEAQVVGPESVEEAEQESVDANRFSGAGRAGDEKVGQVSEIIDQGGAVDVLAEGDGKMGAGAGPLAGLQQIAEQHLDFGGVGDLDGHGVPARDGGEDVDALRLHGAGQVALQIDDALHADAGSGVELVAGDGRTAGDIARADLDVEMGEGLHNPLLVGF